ncbi:MAG TPA: nuclease A inhibitor family protein [Armatimonadota bacterium]|jgi:hypothetical protein
METSIIDMLSQSVEGLLYSSESDEPFDVIEWHGEGIALDERRILELTSSDADTSVETLTLDDFFGPLIADEAWFGREERESAEKYRSLRDLLCRELSDVRMYRVGEVEVGVYIVGRTADGEWVGLHTRSVET